MFFHQTTHAYTRVQTCVRARICHIHRPPYGRRFAVGVLVAIGFPNPPIAVRVGVRVRVDVRVAVLVRVGGAVRVGVIDRVEVAVLVAVAVGVGVDKSAPQTLPRLSLFRLFGQIVLSQMTLVRVAEESTAFNKFAFPMCAPVRFAVVRIALGRMAPMKDTPVRFAPARLLNERSA